MSEGVKQGLGLTAEEAERKLQMGGLNNLPAPKSESLWLRFLKQFNSPLIYILVFALIFDIAIWAHESFKGFPVEFITILAILLLNALLGVWQEAKSENALAKLKAMAAPQSWVYRDGHLTKVPSEHIVPGDIARIEAGERIPADGDIVDAQSFSVDESVLTGESVPIEKKVSDKVLSGTLAVRGSALFRVVHTGPKSNMGKLAHLLTQVIDTKTPLEKRLDAFGKKVAIIVVVLAAGVLATGVTIQGFGAFSQLFLFAVALAVAAVPESLPAVLTLAMALGVERMAQRKAVVRRLTAVEALGSVTVIATDKTGTLTENKMHVDRIDSVDVSLAHSAMVLANDADLIQGVGDPLELGLLKYADEQQVDIQRIRENNKRVNLVPFDSRWKYMSVSIQSATDPEGVLTYYKGAPDVLLGYSDLSNEEKSSWEDRIKQYNSEGFRTLALGYCEGERAAQLDEQSAIKWLGVVLMWDPPRREIPGAIAAAQSAGIRVMMITGDHPATASAIADRIGIAKGEVVTGAELDQMDIEQAVKTASVFARVSPEHKLAIVRTLKSQGQIVAVTGDGVNDAPALKSADVGVAMGNRGSDVSREVADLVLLDDNFSTIVSAIKEGRSIYENIQKFIRTLFSTNLTEVILIALGAAVAFYVGAVDGRLLLPLTAVQILWVNMLTDSLPALAITTDQNPDVMNRPPRSPKLPLLDKPSLRFILYVGVLGGIVALSLLMLLPKLDYSFGQVQTTVFCYLVWVQISFVLPARRVNMPSRINRWVIGALLTATLAQVLVVLVPQFRVLLGLSELTVLLWGVLLSMLTFSWLIAEGITRLIRNSQ